MSSQSLLYLSKHDVLLSMILKVIITKERIQTNFSNLVDVSSSCRFLLEKRSKHDFFSLKEPLPIFSRLLIN